MSEKKWTHVQLSGPGPIAAKLKRLPTGAAIYSFCPSISFPAGLRGQDLLAHLWDLCEISHGPNLSSALGAYESIQLVHKSEVPFTYLKNSPDILAVLEDQSFVECLSEILSAAQELVPPYYVGETRNLQVRVKQHLDANSDLRARLHTKNIPIESLTLRYYLLDKGCDNFLEEEVLGDGVVDDTEDGDVDEDLELNAMIASGLSSASYDAENQEAKRKRKLIEELLSRLCRPRYIEQLGSRQIRIDD